MMDNARTPEEMLKEFELAVQLINSLFIFMMDKKETGSDNLTPVIIYVIIKAKPARLNFNIKFIKYFFDEKDKKGKNEYYIIQAITSIDYIMKTLKIDLKEKNKSKKYRVEVLFHAGYNFSARNVRDNLYKHNVGEMGDSGNTRTYIIIDVYADAGRNTVYDSG